MALFAAAWAVGLFQLLFLRGYGFGTGSEMVSIAHSLAERGAYANPFAPVITGPTALVPPAYPLFLAALLAIFPNPVWMRIAATFANIATNASIAALLPRLSVTCYRDAKAGVIGGVLWILSMRLIPQWDVSATILVQICFCLLTAGSIRRHQGGAWAVGAGLLGGLLLFPNPATAFVMAAWLIWLFVSQRIPRRSAVAYGSILALTMALAVAPWIMRNYRIWGAFVMRNNFGIMLYTSNNDCAGATFYQVAARGCLEKTFPPDNASEAGLLRSLGEVRYDRLRQAAAMQWISSHPGRFAELTAARALFFWFPDPRPLAYGSYGIWLITLLSIPGIILTVRRREAVAPLILSVWLIYPLIYYVVMSADRYRYPILWTSLLPAGYGLSVLSARLRGRLRGHSGDS